ncbi:MAG TPA: type II toxin-antitoxin system VapC family toxin [Candidatus Acidoferrales bacterium]|nr:type II toxin-antitoxin system VapC family toxin [Candidatus Acidoferrales bacterium]
MSVFVVDASVAVKWFFPEIHSDAALRLLLPRHTLHAPDLIFSEFGNVLWKRFRKNEISENEANAALEGLLTVNLLVQPSRLLIPLALDIACAENRTVHDSLYLASALALEFPLVTADAGFYRAVSRGPFSAYLLWVEDVPV